MGSRPSSPMPAPPAPSAGSSATDDHRIVYDRAPSNTPALPSPSPSEHNAWAAEDGKRRPFSARFRPSSPMALFRPRPAGWIRTVSAGTTRKDRVHPISMPHVNLPVGPPPGAKLEVPAMQEPACQIPARIQPSARRRPVTPGTMLARGGKPPSRALSISTSLAPSPRSAPDAENAHTHAHSTNTHAVTHNEDTHSIAHTPRDDDELDTCPLTPGRTAREGLVGGRIPLGRLQNDSNRGVFGAGVFPAKRGGGGKGGDMNRPLYTSRAVTGAWG